MLKRISLLGVLLISIIIAIATTSSTEASSSPERKLQVWVCQSRCGFSLAETLAMIEEFSKHSVTHVSFEYFNLIGDGEIQAWSHNLTQHILGKGMVPVAMLTTVNDQWIEEAWAKRHTGFIRDLHAKANALGVEIIDFDFEPSKGNSKHYADLLKDTQTHFSRHGMYVEADVADWSSVWNFRQLALANLTSPTTMSTYTNNMTFFKRDVIQGIQAFHLDRLVVGLDCKLQKNVIHQVFSFLKEQKVCRISVWSGACLMSSGGADSASWWKHLDEHMAWCKKQ